MESIVLRRYEPGDENGIIELRNEIFDSTKHSDLLTWQWEYVNTSQGMSKIFLYEDHGKIVGHNAIIPILLKYKDKIVLSGKSEGAMMHKRYRGYGNRFINLVKKTLESSHKEGLNVIWGFPNKAAIKPHTMSGFNSIGNVCALIKIINFRPVLERSILSYIKSRFIAYILVNLAFPVLYLLNLFINLRRLNFSKNISVKIISKFDDRIDNLWEKASKDYGITIVRSSKYLNWRFVENPYIANKIFIAERGEEILGYIILSTYKTMQNFKVGFISDLFFIKSEKAALKCLLNRAIRYFEKEAIEIISLLIVKGSYDNKSFLNIFRKRGFIFKNRNLFRPHPFIVNVNENKVNSEFLNDIKNWYITYAFREGI